MKKLELNDEERTLLSEVLATVISELRMEIASTDSSGFREGLKRREVVLKSLLARVDAPS